MGLSPQGPQYAHFSVDIIITGRVKILLNPSTMSKVLKEYKDRWSNWFIAVEVQHVTRVCIYAPKRKLQQFDF